MADDAYTNRELDAKFESVAQRSDENRVALTEKIKDLGENLLQELGEIKQQTVKTNGSVAKANVEIANLKQWKAYVIGFCTCITVLLLPIVYSLLQSGKL